MKLRSAPLAVAIALCSTNAFADGQLEGRLSTVNNSSQSDTSLNGMTITLDELSRETLTSEGGRYRFNQISAGNYTLIVTQGGNIIATEKVTISDDQTTRADILVTAANADDEILVVGQVAQLQRALDRERFAANSISAVDSDAIGQLPDSNAAEALQRVPGLSIERDQGEGRFVRIRGIGAELNSVTVNGAQVPAPEAGSRAVALDVIPSALLSSLTVTKTLTPDMDANAIGGTVDIKSLSPLDQDGAFATVQANTSYDQQSEQNNPSLAASVGNAFELNGDQRLGVALALSWDSRNFGSDNIETGGAWDFEEDPALLEEIEMREYSIKRERLGAALNLEYEVNQDHSFYLNNLYSRFSDDEQRQAAVVEFADAISSGSSSDAEVSRELKDRKETQLIRSSIFGGEHYLNDWIVEYQVGVSKASEDEPDSIAGAAFESSDDIADLTFGSSRRPVINGGSASFYDPAAFELTEIEREKSVTEDIQRQAQLDVSRDFLFNERFATLKTGVKAVKRRKTQDGDVWVYEDLSEDTSVTMENFVGGDRDYSLGRFGPGINKGTVRSYMAGLDREDAFNDEDSTLADYAINENINAAYLMGSMDISDSVHLIAGVRHEKTDTELNGNALTTDDELAKVKQNNNYSNTLPAILTRWDINRNTQMRAAWTNAVVRPTFEQMSPNFTDDGEEAELGNPNLKPLEAANLDLSVAHYMGTASVVSAGLFYKAIDNFAYETDLAGAPQYADYDEVITFKNGDEATLRGLELAFSHKFSSLPAPFNGMLINANATFTSSDATVSGYVDGELTERDIALPNQSDVTGNLIIGYEDTKFSVRVATNYKSEYLAEVNSLENGLSDVYQSSQTQMDLNTAYNATENVKFTFEVMNLTDEPYYAYQNSERYNAQYEDYGPTYRLGVRFSHF